MYIDPESNLRATSFSLWSTKCTSCGDWRGGTAVSIVKPSSRVSTWNVTGSRSDTTVSQDYFHKCCKQHKFLAVVKYIAIHGLSNMHFILNVKGANGAAVQSRRSGSGPALWPYSHGWRTFSLCPTLQSGAKSEGHGGLGQAGQREKSICSNSITLPMVGAPPRSNPGQWGTHNYCPPCKWRTRDTSAVTCRNCIYRRLPLTFRSKSWPWRGVPGSHNA